MDRAALLSQLSELSTALSEAYLNYAFQWAVEKEARSEAIQNAWAEQYNASQTSDYAFVKSLDESIKTVALTQEIKALEQEYAHVKFLIESAP